MGEAKRRAEEEAGRAEGNADWTRRSVLAAAAGALSLPLGWWLTRDSGAAPSPTPTAVESPERAALEAALDVLLPSGELPGHRETGLLAVLWAAAEGTPAVRERFREGARLLDEACPGGFVAAGAEERTLAMGRLAQASPGSAQRSYYRFLRDQAMRLHYTHPASWGPLGFGGPPQPRGHPDYTEAPRG